MIFNASFTIYRLSFPNDPVGESIEMLMFLLSGQLMIRFAMIRLKDKGDTRLLLVEVFPSQCRDCRTHSHPLLP